MKDVKVFLYKAVSVVLPLALIFANLCCSLPTYVSPTPGIIEVRMQTISTQIPFTPLNNFNLTLSAVYAIRADRARLVIYQDVKAIDRTPSVLNTLDSLAKTGNMVLGSVFAPPGDYSGVNLLYDLGTNPLVNLDGYRQIPVDTTGYGFNSSLVSNASYSVRENDTTRIYLTINLDSALVKGAEKYYFNQAFLKISSIH
ncbi:MAG: hypothetical protein ACHQQQ_15300 [Bacteroidota bacterium]